MKQLIILILFSFALLTQGNAESNSSKLEERQEAIPTDEVAKEDEKLRLMYQVFTYSSDLEHAYEVSGKALKLYPESLYWHRKRAEVSEWLDKRTEAIKHLQIIYKRTEDVEVEKQILDYALSAYQYEAAAPILKKKALKNPTKKNINNLVFIYDKTGSPEVAAETLEVLSKRENAKSIWIQKALHIYIDLGDEESILRVITDIKKKKSISVDLARELSSYYLTQQNLEASYEILLRGDTTQNEGNTTKYYQQLSDLGWYLQKYEVGAKASKALYSMKAGRLRDYERILYHYDKKDAGLVERATLEGYNRYNKDYLYMAYLNTLYVEKKYAELSKAYKRIEGTSQARSLESNVYHWLMKGQMYGALGQKENALASFKQAMKIEPDSPSITATVLWFFIDDDDQDNVRKMIFEIEEEDQVHPELWLPMAVGHFMLQRPDRSMWYVKGLMMPGKDNIDAKMMYAYIMQTREETDAFMKTMREVYQTLDAQKTKNPQLMKEKEFLDRYLKSSMYFIDVDQFDMLLEQSKKVLDKKVHTEISIFWVLRRNSHERARYLAGKLDKIEPWMQLNIALNDDDRTAMSDLMDRHFSLLPIRDRVTAATKTGDIALAQSLAFMGLENNRYDYLLYKQRRDLIEKHVDFLTLQVGHLNRSSISQNYLEFSNRYYLGRSWSLLTDIYAADNKNLDPDNIINMPTNDKSISFGLKRVFTQGYAKFMFGARDSLESYYNFSLFGHYEPMSKVIVEAEYLNSAKAEETAYLLLGGKKDALSVKTQLQYLPSSNISLSMSYDIFYAQDDVKLGEGYRGRLEWYNQIRSGYPDMAWGLFYEYRKYSEDNGTKGSLDTLLPFGGNVLPETSYNIGTNFFYGMENKYNYTRVWRPYVEFSPYYNSLNEQFNFFIGAGYGGHIYDKDHMTVGFNYDQAVNGTQESSFNLFMRYYMLY